MSKRRKIIIVLCVLTIGVLTIGVLAGGAFAYILFSSKTSDGEAVFAPTEVGTPEGPNVTKDIGPAGGSIASPDGRLTLTVPQNALTETVAFSIQPVTNKFDGGLGLAYRLEPNGKTFATPLDISVHYDDHDLEGTLPEALSIAYQDKERAWHLQKAITLDKDKKTITVSATHFSTYDLMALVKLSPAKATLHVGESVDIVVTSCEGLVGILDKLMGISSESVCRTGWEGGDSFKLLGEGKLKGDYPRMIYTAPGKKPTPNVATVVFSKSEFLVSVEVPCPRRVWFHQSKEVPEPPTIRKKCHEMVPGPRSLEAKITIIDRGYRASGQDGPTSYSGVVCSLDEPFTITGNNALVGLPLKFVPSSGTAGTLSYSATYKVLTMAGSGTYTVEGADTDKPRILAQTKSTLSGMGHSSSGGGPAHIDLTPLDTDECSKKP